MPADPDFDNARQAWNLAVDQRPEFVVQVADVADIVAVIDYARANGLRVAPQGTGHNAAPLGDLAGTILLRTDLLREVTVDPAARVVRVGAGVLWQEVTDALAAARFDGARRFVAGCRCGRLHPRRRLQLAEPPARTRRLGRHRRRDRHR